MLEILKKDLDEVKKLDHKELLILDENGYNLLHHLCYDCFSNEEIILYIISNVTTEDLNITTSLNETPLYLAINGYNKEACELLIPKMNLKGLLKYPKYDNSRPLQRAEDQWFWEVMKLIGEKINELEITYYQEMLDAYNIYFKDPYETRGFVLVDCTEKNQLEGIKLLKEVFNKIDFTYKTPLHIAIQQGAHNGLCKFIINNMDIEDINRRTDRGTEGDYTVLHFCAVYDKIDIAEILIPKMKENINYISKYAGETALHKAIEKRNSKLCELLINNMSCSAINAEDFLKKTAFDIISKYHQRNTNILNMLKEKNKYILHAAVERNNIDTCKFIINENNEYQFIKDENGKYPLDIAIENGYKEIEELLREKLNYTLSDECLSEK
jgi:ankyrin repeat protein